MKMASSASMMRAFTVVSFSVGTVLACANQAAAAVFDLSADWTDGTNPNGPWSYREGNTVLPFDPSWTAGVSFPVAQPAYHPADVGGNFLPAWYKATSNPVGFDNLVGDVIVHTNDGFNGNPALGVANVLFTVPFAGLFNVSGQFWDAVQTHPDRPQDWVVLVNGVADASGLLSGTVARATAQTFNLSNLFLLAGDTINLQVFEAPGAAAGFFVGTGLTITGTATPPPGIPEPSTISVLILSLLGLGLIGGRGTLDNVRNKS